MATLFEQLGGQAALESAVFIFYDKIMKDDQLNHYFTNVDMETQQRKMVGFMAQAFGSEYDHTRYDLRKAHAKHSIGDADFDRVAGHLQATLAELDVPEHLQDIVLNIIDNTRYDVVTVKTNPVH